MTSSHSDIRIRRVEGTLPDCLAELIIESEQEGFQFLHRLIDDWNDGSNRFSRKGEALFIAQHRTQIVGVGGLNIDPYADMCEVGRVRRVFVAAKFRRQGIGSRLLNEIIMNARLHFVHLHLLTNSQEAAKFYTALGFALHVGIPHCSHILQLEKSSD